MDVPNWSHAAIADTKVRDYLLSTTHSKGRSKAAFFLRFGFTQDAWQALSAALLEHAASHDARVDEDTPFGTQYIVEGPLTTPDGRAPLVRSVWIIAAGESVPRLVTAYPMRGES